MSVGTSVSVVDWGEFSSFIANRGQVEEFIERFPASTLADNSQARQMDFLEAVEEINGHWPTASKEAFSRVFGALFWTWVSPSRRVMDAQADAKANEWIESALSPDTVRRLAGTWREIKIDQLEDKSQSLPPGPFDTFADFASYAKEWGRFVEKAAREGKGLVICCWG